MSSIITFLVAHWLDLIHIALDLLATVSAVLLLIPGAPGSAFVQSIADFLKKLDLGSNK